MITKVPSFKTNNKIFESLAGAQREELAVILTKGDGGTSLPLSEVCDLILQNADKVIDILTMKETSKPRARKVNGGTKKRERTTVQAAGITSAKSAAVNRELQDGKQ